MRRWDQPELCSVPLDTRDAAAIFPGVMGKRRDGPHLKVCSRLQRDFGRRLQERRRERGVLQKNLAAAMSLTRTSVSNIERGEQRVYLDQVYQAAQFLQVDVATLLPAVEEVFQAPPIRTVTDDPLPPAAAEQASKIVKNLVQPRKRRRSR